jgi:hypothetical protein
LAIGIADLSLRIITLLLLVSAHFVLAQTPLEDALSAIERGDYSRAEQILSTSPQPLLQGILQFHRGDYASAEKNLVQALEKNDSSSGRAFLALTRAAIGGCDSARAELEQTFRQTGSGEPHRLTGLALAQCHLAASRFSESFAVLANLASFFLMTPTFSTSRPGCTKAWNDAVFRCLRKHPPRSCQSTSARFLRFKESMAKQSPSFARPSRRTLRLSTCTFGWEGVADGVAQCRLLKRRRSLRAN